MHMKAKFLADGNNNLNTNIIPNDVLGLVVTSNNRSMIDHNPGAGGIVGLGGGFISHT